MLVERDGSVMSKKEQKGNKLLGNFKKVGNLARFINYAYAKQQNKIL